MLTGKFTNECSQMLANEWRREKKEPVRTESIIKKSLEALVSPKTKNRQEKQKKKLDRSSTRAANQQIVFIC